MKTKCSGSRAEFLAIKSSMPTVDFVQLPAEGREYTADSVGSTWRQEYSHAAGKFNSVQKVENKRARGIIGANMSKLNITEVTVLCNRV